MFEKCFIGILIHHEFIKSEILWFKASEHIFVADLIWWLSIAQ